MDGEIDGLMNGWMDGTIDKWDYSFYYYSLSINQSDRLTDREYHRYCYYC